MLCAEEGSLVSRSSMASLATRTSRARGSETRARGRSRGRGLRSGPPPLVGDLQTL